MSSVSTFTFPLSAIPAGQRKPKAGGGFLETCAEPRIDNTCLYETRGNRGDVGGAGGRLRPVGASTYWEQLLVTLQQQCSRVQQCSIAQYRIQQYSSATETSPTGVEKISASRYGCAWMGGLLCRFRCAVVQVNCIGTAAVLVYIYIWETRVRVARGVRERGGVE